MAMQNPFSITRDAALYCLQLRNVIKRERSVVVGSHLGASLLEWRAASEVSVIVLAGG